MSVYIFLYSVYVYRYVNMCVYIYIYIQAEWLPEMKAMAYMLWQRVAGTWGKIFGWIHGQEQSIEHAEILIPKLVPTDPKAVGL